MPTASTPDFGKITVDTTWKIAIVRSLWHGDLTSELAESAVRELVSLGIPGSNIVTIEVPGAFELPLACLKALEESDGAIAFGVVLAGETHHARLVADQAAVGLMQAQLTMKKPITFEVLLVDDIRHAEVRSVGQGSKGPLAARTLLTSLAHLSK